MNEYTKALKTVHQVLMLASAAVLAFALTPNIDPQYNKADAQLAKLQSLSSESWQEFLGNVEAPDIKKQNDELTRIIRQVDPSYLPLDAQLPGLMYVDLSNPIEAKVIDLVNLVQSEQQIQSVRFQIQDFNEVENQWRSSLCLADPVTREPKIKSVTLTPPERGGDGTRIQTISIHNQSIDRTAHLNILVDLASIPVCPAGNPVPIPVTATLEPVRKGRFISDYFQKEGVVLTGLQPFLNEVGGLTVTEARQTLRQQRDSKPRKVSLLGFNVDADATVGVAPWAISAVLLFLIAHLRQFRLGAMPTEKDVTAWVGLFSDWVGRAIACGTTLIIPPLATGLLVWRYGHSKNPASAEMVSFYVTTALSVWAYSELLRCWTRHRSDR